MDASNEPLCPFMSKSCKEHDCTLWAVVPIAGSVRNGCAVKMLLSVLNVVERKLNVIERKMEHLIND
jgi:hypothetical protein